MGAYNRGGIKLLCDIVKPKIGIITGVNEQHLALFGSMENLLSAEGGKELIEALDKKMLVGVGLDVLEGEKLIKEEKQLLYDQKKLKALGDLVKGHIILSNDNVVFTPHIVFYSQEALVRINKETTENITAFLSGNPQNVVVQR